MPRVEAKHVSYYRRWCVLPGIVVLRVVVLGLVVTELVYAIEGGREVRFNPGDEPKGLYILVSGLLEATYEPPEGDFDEAIPNYEFLSDLKFNDPSQDYIVSGNAVGVLGVLTNRPYSYTVRCDTAVQAYFITMSVIKEAFNLAPHPIMGLEAAMWREIGIKLSLMVLPSVPAYHGWSVERLSMRLEHAFVPCLKAFKVFVVNELMEDIVLIDGICQDMSTREVFQPPCYIPRTAHRLVFPKSSQMLISNTCPETKLLIVPAKDTDELDIMEDEVFDMQCELVCDPDLLILNINAKWPGARHEQPAPASLSPTIENFI